MSLLAIAAALSAIATDASGQTLTTLGSFNGTNGGYGGPCGGLTLIGPTLYGTASNGGTSNDGAVFSIPVGGGTPAVLGPFSASSGFSSSGSLTLIGSTLYGTAGNGGASGYGTVFSIPVGGGTPTALGSFNYSNGEHPYGSLTLIGSTLYGTTLQGGAGGGYGAVFSIPVGGGTPTALGSFKGSNGFGPSGGLTLIGSTLYGTTNEGGAKGDGTVFSIPVGGGTPTDLGSFSGSNGQTPEGGLTLIGSTLYGTTYQGGASNDGTVFSIPVGGGSPTAVGSFNGSNGSNPRASLALSADGSTLYGTTQLGGAGGDGTVFSIPVGGGTPTALVSFNGGNGEWSLGDLTLSADGSTFYGTTEIGGANNDGTVFALTLPTPEPAALALLGAGAIGLAGYVSWRRRRRPALTRAGEAIVSSGGGPDLQEGGPAILSLPSRRAEAKRRAA
jgi:uncharacterized repeat protein (TIGR03803 family)